MFGSVFKSVPDRIPTLGWSREHHVTAADYANWNSQDVTSRRGRGAMSLADPGTLGRRRRLTLF